MQLHSKSVQNFKDIKIVEKIILFVSIMAVQKLKNVDCSPTQELIMMKLGIYVYVDKANLRMMVGKIALFSFGLAFQMLETVVFFHR